MNVRLFTACDNFSGFSSLFHEAISAALGRSFGINKILVMRMAHKTGTQVTVPGLLNLK